MPALEEAVLDCLADGIETTELVWGMLDDIERAQLGSERALQELLVRLQHRGLVSARDGVSHHGTEIVTWWESSGHAERQARLRRQLAAARDLRLAGHGDLELDVSDPAAALALAQKELPVVLPSRGFHWAGAGTKAAGDAWELWTPTSNDEAFAVLHVSHHGKLTLVSSPRLKPDVTRAVRRVLGTGSE